MNTIDKNRMYFSALYDFAYLEKHFINSPNFRSSFSVRWEFIENEIRDAITDSVPLPDLFHHLQISHAFIEKFLKYLISNFDNDITINQLIGYKHNIQKLLKHTKKINYDLDSKLENEEYNLLETISKMDFPSLRYTQPQVFTINFRTLKNLILKIFVLLKEIRFENTKSISKEEQKSKKDGRIFGHLVKKIAPKKFNKNRFEQILTSDKISNSQRELIQKSYQNSDSDVLLVGNENDLELISAIEIAGEEVWDFGEIRFEIT
ncbi:hypothetical protein [Leptospira ryugenii]|nr:hypothetical protein [Leptospira ryugenii]